MVQTQLLTCFKLWHKNLKISHCQLELEEFSYTEEETSCRKVSDEILQNK